MLLAAQGKGPLLPSQSQTSCSPLLPPVLPFTICMFLNWHSRQVTLKTSSQNIYWGKRKVESLFIDLFYKVSRNRTEGWWFSGLFLLSAPSYWQAWEPSQCVIHPVKPPDSTVVSMAALFPGIFSPRAGNLAWLPEQSIKPKDRLESQNQLGLWFSLNSFLAMSLTLLFLLLQGIILLPYHWINQLCLKAWKHHVFLSNI